MFSYRKVLIRKQFFTGFDIKKVSPLAWHFLCLSLQKTVFRSLPFHIWTQFGEQIAKLIYYYSENRISLTLSKCTRMRRGVKNPWTKSNVLDYFLLSYVFIWTSRWAIAFPTDILSILIKAILYVCCWEFRITVWLLSKARDLQANFMLVRVMNEFNIAVDFFNETFRAPNHNTFF